MRETKTINGANLAVYLRELRSAVGMTIEKVAVAAGVSYSTVQNIERGCRCSDDVARRILDVIEEARA